MKWYYNILWAYCVHNVHVVGAGWVRNTPTKNSQGLEMEGRVAFTAVKPWAVFTVQVKNVESLHFVCDFVRTKH